MAIYWYMTMIQEKLMERMECIWCRGTMGVYLNILLGWKSVWDIKMNGGPVDFYSSLDTVHLYLPDWDTIHHHHHHHQFRVEVFPERRDRRSCKICASCVFLPNWRRTTRFNSSSVILHLNCWNFTQLNSYNKLLKLLISMYLRASVVSECSCNIRTFIV